MPRRPKQTEAPVIPTNSLVASSTMYPGKAPRIYQQRKDWQEECYRHHAICGEARFAANFFGNAVSKAVLSSPEEQETLDNLFNGINGQREMLKAIGVHLTIAGECYLVGRTVEGTELWEILSVLEVDVTGDKWYIKTGEGMERIELSESDVVIRIWLPSPTNRYAPESPFRALLPILTEIEWLTRHVFAQVQSRLAGAGILLMPNDMTFPPPPAVNGKEVATANQAESFMIGLADAMIEPIKDPSSPAALMPYVVTASPDSIDKPRLLKFWSELDANAQSLRTEAIRRFALGMDMPPEQVLGMGSNPGSGGGTSNGVSHWGAWQIEESTIKMHIEPMLDVVVNAVTMSYLRPLSENEKATTVYDTSALRLRPDRSKEAVELWDRGMLSTEVMLRENGFSEEDMPGEAEFKRWLLVKIASGSATPEQVQAALSALGVELTVDDPGDRPREARPAPSTDDHPTRPRTPDETALLAASEGLVFRALERAGNRLRQSVGRPPGVPAYETHVHVRANGSTASLLSDAWSCAPQVLDGIADTDKVVDALNAYCTTLLNEQSPHTRDRLRTWLTLVEES